MAVQGHESHEERRIGTRAEEMITQRDNQVSVVGRARSERGSVRPTLLPRTRVHCIDRPPRALGVPHLIPSCSLPLNLQRRHGSQILPCQEARLSPANHDLIEKTGDKARQQKTEPTHRQKHHSGDDSGRPTRASHLSNPPDPLRARHGPTVFDTSILRGVVPSAVARDALHWSRRSRMGCCER